MSIYSKLKFHTTGGTNTTESVSSVNDVKTGTAFAGKFFMVFGPGALNTTHINWTTMLGFADATSGRAGAGGNESNDFGGKIIRGGAGNVPIYIPSGAIGGGNLQIGTISNITAGGFDITFTANYSGHSFAILVLGGSSLDVKIASMAAATKQTTTFQPEASLFWYQSTTGSPANGGSAFPSFGFAERNGATGTMALSNNSQGSSSRYQRSDKCIALLTSTPAVSIEKAVVSWQSDGFTLDSATGAAFSYAALGGLNTKGGAQTQPTSPGTQTLATGFDPLALIVFSCGKTAGTSIVTDKAGWSIGVYDGSSTAGYWTNEDLQGNASPVHGGKRLSNADILQFCDSPAGAGSSISAKAQITAWNRTTGNITVNWSAADATARQYFWLALGIPIVPVISTFGPLLGQRQHRLARA